MSTRNTETDEVVTAFPSRFRAIKERYEMIKPLVEMTLALVMLVFSLPLILLAMVLVKLNSRGPSIYRQNRVGRMGRIFTIYKIRTMYHDSERSFGSTLVGSRRSASHVYWSVFGAGAMSMSCRNLSIS